MCDERCVSECAWSFEKLLEGGPMVNEDVFFFCEYLVGMMFSGSRIRGGGQLNEPHYTDVRVCVCVAQTAAET